jgi:hypothetical protein
MSPKANKDRILLLFGEVVNCWNSLNQSNSYQFALVVKVAEKL